MLINFLLLINQPFKLFSHLLEATGAKALFCALLFLGMARIIKLTKLFFKYLCLCSWRFSLIDIWEK